MVRVKVSVSVIRVRVRVSLELVRVRIMVSVTVNRLELVCGRNTTLVRRKITQSPPLGSRVACDWFTQSLGCTISTQYTVHSKIATVSVSGWMTDLIRVWFVGLEWHNGY